MNLTVKVRKVFLYFHTKEFELFRWKKMNKFKISTGNSLLFNTEIVWWKTRPQMGFCQYHVVFSINWQHFYWIFSSVYSQTNCKMFTIESDSVFFSLCRLSSWGSFVICLSISDGEIEHKIHTFERSRSQGDVDIFLGFK